MIGSALSFLVAFCFLFLSREFFANNSAEIENYHGADLSWGCAFSILFTVLAAGASTITPYQRRPISVGEIAENGILIAMAFGLNFIKLPIHVEGGSVNFQMLPLMIIALRRGPASGLICGGILFGLLTCLTDGYGFACYPFDYLIGFGSVAVMGFFRPFIFGQNQKGYNFKGEAFLLLAGVLSTFIRFMGSTVSSVVIYQYTFVAAMAYNVLYISLSGVCALAVAFFSASQDIVFDAFRIEKDYQLMNTSKDGKAIFLLSQNESVDAFNYKNVEIQKLDSMIPCGNNGNQADIYYQSVTGLKTDLEVGTAVEVELDVQVTGSFNEWCQIVWVDEVWSAEGGEADKKAVRIDSLFDYGNTGWQHIKFSATVRNFPVLRFNGGYAQKADTSAFGNAVYLMAMNKSENSFSYKNAKISTVPSMIPAGKNSKNAYQQSLAVLPSDLAIGTSVDVEFDALLTGTFDEWCQIYWIDKVWTAEGGEANAEETRIEKLFDFANKDWQHIKFSANIREFPALRVGTDYPIYDTSKMGKGVYLLSMNPSEQSFNYKNVVITAK